MRPTARIRDVSGICLPGFCGDAVDVLRTLSALQTSDRAEQLITLVLEGKATADETNASADVRCTLKTVLDLIEVMPRLARSRLFDPPFASLEAPLDSALDDGVADDRQPLDRAISLARYVIGSPDTGAYTLVMPPAFLEPAGAYLPHLRVVISGAGPLAILAEPQRTIFHWTDGFAVTIPNRPSPLPPAAVCERMHALLTAGSIPILNAVPRIQQVTRGYVLAQGAQLNGMISRFADGLALLQMVWPEAFSSIQRHLKGIIALVPRSYACSHSPFHMNGVVLLTMDDPAKIADLLVHEVAHIRLNFLRQQDPLIEQDIGGKTYFSPWRQDRRPLIGVILGVHAFLNVCHYYRRLAAMPVYRCGAEAIYERQRSNVLAGWAEAQPHLHATQAAEAFFTELEREVMAL